ncbi:putative esterase [Sugiyamaella lignohabitans]|uniref:Putative esterase n=1 Tax=Sugiyamaella lignohabitans TaxID=796027 RepID=A0A161HG22_9ASCO|nr:putative esterase [Sugiyamaella lignohabitans]ANB11631.1 putative esterase [Sugiyamaella lignohabitans]
MTAETDISKTFNSVSEKLEIPTKSTLESTNNTSDMSVQQAIPPAPYQIDPSIIGKFDKEYVNFFNSHLTRATNLLYTHLGNLQEIKAGGNVIPGQSPLAPLKSTYDIQIPRKYTKADTTIPARVFVPVGEAPEKGWPCTVWYHGGGWVLGSIDTENSYCSHIADNAKCIVISVDYRLAPEFPFPACIDDSYEALLHIYENASKFNIDNSKIAVAGSSAGGNISAVLTHKYASDPISKSYHPLAFQLLIVPVCDNTADSDTHLSYKEFRNTVQLPRDKMFWYRNLYLPNKEDWNNPVASPYFYPAESFKNCPPAFIAVAACDVLRTEGEEYAAKLQEAGVDAELVIYPGVPHTVMVMDDVLTQGRRLVKETTGALKNAFYNN